MSKVQTSNNRRVIDDAAFVLQTWDWKETSLLVEFFTLRHGKVVAVARGAKRASSQFRGILTPFAPLAISYSGENEVKNLTRSRWIGGFYPLQADALFAGFYVNELLVRLLAREDPIEGLFGSYVEVLKSLASSDMHHEVALRTFELDLMQALGYGLPNSDAAWVWDGTELKPIAHRIADVERHLVIEPEMIQAVLNRDFKKAKTLHFAKRLMRAMINHYAGDKPLNTRRILQEFKKL